MGVHPRSRGAALASLLVRLIVQGPSPLTRGRLPLRSLPMVVVGSIPAHAGPPTGAAAGLLGGGVHPRSRGAALVGDMIQAPSRGPSPLTRGRQRVAALQKPQRGSIPAHAGPPPESVRCRHAAWVHPRSRGAAARPMPLAASQKGPSPLTRGRQMAAPPGAPCRWSIPAHAGPPRCCGTQRRSRGVHPRSRGAAPTVANAWNRSLGPSPLTRGRQAPALSSAVIEGSIPAHAGPPPMAWTAKAGQRVHPRSRGAATGFEWRAGVGLGPSPLTRGRPWPAMRAHIARGSIPAHAGPPGLVTPGRLVRRVHPRSRGAAYLRRSVAAPLAGPSPLTRGRLDLAAQRGRRGGSIPAHAGPPWAARATPPRSRVHPRSRGAATDRPANDWCHRGPSPLTRGRR